MTVLLHCVHDTISLAMYEDLARALRAAGHEVRFQFGGGIALQQCLLWIRAYGFELAPADWRPDVLFVADFRAYERRPGAIVVDIGHGIGSKDSYYYADTDYLSDYVFFPSESLAARVRRESGPTVVSVGMPKLDRAVHQRAGRASNPRPVVLVAPTHNEEYACITTIWDQLGALAEEYRVVVKPHEYHFTAPKLAHWPGRFRAAPPGVEVVRQANVADLLAVADVVVSDVSSVYLEAVGIGVPTVVCASPAMRDEAATPRGQERNEYRFQRAAHVITDGAQLADAVALAASGIEGPDAAALRPRILEYPGVSIPRVLSLLPTLHART